MASEAQHRSAAALQENKAVWLANAYVQLERILETVDLKDEPQLAEAVIEAVEVTDKAYTLVSDEENPLSSDT
ncbi:hypothetical protein G9464_17180 [Halostella sp. JP-L12]|uniref:hypothetical protein n=1 Tax=Halostella TaxID=1843185 RepID=UPI0013CEB4FE|nr:MULTISPECIES: hypothetical protein [Halostella]NHN49308.1 hypothetical protein [Halostella sp. JP-L12]